MLLSTRKNLRVFLLKVQLEKYIKQEAKESLASPDHLFDGKLNVVKIVDEN